MRQDSRRERSGGPRTFTLAATDEYEICVYQVLQKWALTVYRLPARTVVTEDFFPDRGTAVGRAYDFRAIIVNRENPEAGARAGA